MVTFIRAVKVQGHETNLRGLGLQDTPEKVFWALIYTQFYRIKGGGIAPAKMWKMEPLRSSKNAFPAHSYGHEIS